ncbi:MAG: prenyltransferase/squalene oxidase repeat-containing protein [Candidatus Thorarchaeota archaeon]
MVIETITKEKKGVDVKNALKYVRQHGGKIDIIRLQHFLGKLNFSVAEETLSKYQFPNGGWYYEDDSTKTLSVGASNLWLRVLLELELTNTPIVKRTAEFLIKNQDPDGSWYELKEKLEKSPQPWLNPDVTDNRLWFTISATVFLTASGFESHPAIKKAGDYLSTYWDNHKKFRVTWYPYWAGIPFFAKTRGTNSEAFVACHSYTTERLDQYNGFHLGWVLDMCKLANLPASDSLVRASLDRLENLQRQDGAWSSKYGDVYCTLFALNILRHYGRIA